MQQQVHFCFQTSRLAKTVQNPKLWKNDEYLTEYRFLEKTTNNSIIELTHGRDEAFGLRVFEIVSCRLSCKSHLFAHTLVNC